MVPLAKKSTSNGHSASKKRVIMAVPANLTTSALIEAGPPFARHSLDIASVSRWYQKIHVSSPATMQRRNPAESSSNSCPSSRQEVARISFFLTCEHSRHPLAQSFQKFNRSCRIVINAFLPTPKAFPISSHFIRQSSLIIASARATFSSVTAVAGHPGDG